MTRYFEYGQEEIDYLAARDPRLGEAMAAVGHVYASSTTTCSALSCTTSWDSRSPRPHSVRSGPA